MRPAQLRALLKELRSGGVSEYATTDRQGHTTSLKLAGPFAPSASTVRAKPVNVANPGISSEMRKQLEELGINVDDAREVLATVGIGGHDGN